MSRRPICVPCSEEMAPMQNDCIVEVREKGNGQPFQKWASDKWKCVNCGHEICCGFGSAPLAEWFSEGYNDLKAGVTIYA